MFGVCELETGKDTGEQEEEREAEDKRHRGQLGSSGAPHAVANA